MTSQSTTDNNGPICTGEQKDANTLFHVLFDDQGNVQFFNKEQKKYICNGADGSTYEGLLVATDIEKAAKKRSHFEQSCLMKLKNLYDSLEDLELYFCTRPS